ncbi:MAG TPA: hypothetical protein VFA79_19060, partial [Myxococcales bacterium]|nr:hypothetical protein [Myxococcales bacterium]
MLRFKVGPFPVLVYPWFFISAVLLGPGIDSGWVLVAWVLVVFVSVLGHELGHAIVGRVYGGQPEIRLEAFGGVTFPKVARPLGPARQFVLSFAGPIAGLLIGAAAYGLGQALPPAEGSISAFMVEATVEVSKLWA